MNSWTTALFLGELKELGNRRAQQSDSETLINSCLLVSFFS